MIFLGDGLFSEAMLVSGSVCRGIKNTKFFEYRVYIAVKWHLPSQKSKIRIFSIDVVSFFHFGSCPFELKKARGCCLVEDSFGIAMKSRHEQQESAITILTIMYYYYGYYSYCCHYY